jgi:RHS repeat-associated protein
MPAVPDNTLNFTYDDFGNRTQKQSTNCTHTYYLNSGNTVLNEINSTGTTTKSIVYGLSQIAEIDTNNTITYTHQDTLGSTVLTTNQSGSVVTKYQYDPFGQLIGQDGKTNTNYLYTNQEYDQESELYYYNARYYNPRLGRFISRDPYLGRDGDTLSRNGYTYVKNNPLKYVDPSGETEQENVFDKFANQGICGVNMSCETTKNQNYFNSLPTGISVINNTTAPVIGSDYVWSMNPPPSYNGKSTSVVQIYNL